MLDHIDSLVRRLGVDHVGIGSDFDGYDGVTRGLEDVSPLASLTAALGDPNGFCLESLIQGISQSDRVRAECLRRTADQMMKDIAGESPSRLELMAVQRVVNAWIRLSFVDALTPFPGDGKSTPALSAAQRGLNSALKDLSLVRKDLRDV